MTDYFDWLSFWHRTVDLSLGDLAVIFQLPDGETYMSVEHPRKHEFRISLIRNGIVILKKRKTANPKYITKVLKRFVNNQVIPYLYNPYREGASFRRLKDEIEFWSDKCPV